MLLESTFLPITPSYYYVSSGLLLIPIVQSSGICFYGTPNPWRFLLPLPAPSLHGSPPNPGNPKPHLCLFCSAIGCWHLYLPIRINLGAESQELVDSRSCFTPALNIIIHSKKTKTSTVMSKILAWMDQHSLPACWRRYPKKHSCSTFFIDTAMTKYSS